MTALKVIKGAFRKKQKHAYQWYHGALFLAGISLLERGLEALTKKLNPQISLQDDDQAFYQTLKQPFFAPPAKAFPIAWAACDIALIWANLRVLNMPAVTPGRREYLGLQAASWGIYSIFTAMHFGLRSPLNALTLTTIHTGLNTASGAIALTQLKDSKVALLHAPVLGWLSLALPTAVTTAIWNKDPFYNKGPFVQPRKEWLKAG